MENKEENTATLPDGTELLESEMTQEQLVAIRHIKSLRNKIANLEFELNELLPSLRFYENSFVESTKEKAEEVMDDKSNNTKGGKK
jgi:hypothetical protein|tara:strand:- start:403 stop:660 length:258 start_codon:yes stop_codon:yes gene_type:complete